MSQELFKSAGPFVQKFDPTSERRTLKRALQHSNTLIHFSDLDFYPFPETGFINTEFAFNAKQFFESNQDSDGLVQVRFDFENKGNWGTDFQTVPVFYHKFSSGGKKTIRMQAKRGEMLSEVITKEIYVRDGLRIGENLLREIVFTNDGKSIIILSSNRIKVLGIDSGDTLLIGGYEEEISTMKLSSDGKTLITGSQQGIVKIWDILTGECVKIINAHQKDIFFLHVSPSSKFILTYGAEGILSCWNLENSEPVWQNKISREFIKTIAISPDEKNFAIGSELKTIMTGTFSDGNLSNKIELENSWVEKVVYNQAGHLLASVRNGQEGKIIKVNDFMTVVRVGDGETLNTLKISNDGKYALVFTTDHRIKVWDLNSGDFISSFYSSDDWVFDDPFDPNSSLVACRGFDNSIKLYNILNGGCFAIFMMPEGYVKSSEFHPTENKVAVGGTDNKIRFWDLSSGEVSASFDSSYQWPKTTAFNNNGSLVAFTTTEKVIQIWKSETVEFQKEIVMFDDKIKQIVFNHSGEKLFIRGEHTISIYDLKLERFIQSFEGNAKIVKTAIITPDGNNILSSGSDFALRLWSIETGLALKEFKGLSSFAQEITVTPDFRYLISRSEMGQMVIWDYNSAKLLWQLNNPEKKVSSYGLSSDHLMIVSSIKNEIYLWATLTGNSLGFVGKHNETVTSLIFHPNNKLIISGALDNTTKIWNMSDYSLIKTMKGGSNLRISPTGRYLMNGYGGEIRIWDLNHELRIS